MSVTTAGPAGVSQVSTSSIIANDSSRSAVSWGAIFVGAAAAAALSLVLVILGFGLGLSSVSPWSGVGATAGTIGVATVVWIAFTQFAASGVGGYLAGRLRVKWSALHTDEVYFRDTAHGFMAWAVATLVVAAFLGSTLAGILDTGATAGASLVGGATSAVAAAAGTASSSDDSSGLNYFTDRLYRKPAAQSGAATGPSTSATPASHAEAMRIFATSLKNGQLSDDDRDYLANVVAQETGISAQEASARVNDGFAKAKKAADDAAAAAKQAAETARKAAAHGALWSFVALMIGAFIASFSATIGGRRRDLHA
jgi:hypothetical protein